MPRSSVIAIIKLIMLSSYRLIPPITLTIKQNKETSSHK